MIAYRPAYCAEDCADCHPDVQQTLSASVHGKADKKPGDHPTCTTCHGQDPHATEPVTKLSRRQKAILCGDCHDDQARMARYGVDPEAVSSYKESFHGKKLLRFHKQDSAACNDCHGNHEISVFGQCAPHPDGALLAANCSKCSSRERAGLLRETCAKCHKGANINFCMSGANHMRLKIESSPLLVLEDLFFRLLTYGTMALLLGMVALDLRRKVFYQHCRPKAGRLVAGFIALGFALLTAGMVMSLTGLRGAQWTWLAATAAMGFALIFYYARTHPRLVHEPERIYERLTLSLRVQHIILAVSFIVLVLTGMPLRFAQVGWSHYLHLLFGGFEGARIAHRVAAILMTGTWLWHFGFLLYRWKKVGFSLRSWTMMPTRKDFTDFFQTIRYGLGLTHQRPLYDRFQWREKFDYFAVYWGMPIMIFSGAVLWWPVFWGNRLTDLGLAVAYIAHSDEALLAFLAIALWHLYNTHLDPEHFPMNPVWYSGVLSESEMDREHPVEKARVEKKEQV